MVLEPVEMNGKREAFLAEFAEMHRFLCCLEIIPQILRVQTRLGGNGCVA